MKTESNFKVAEELSQDLVGVVSFAQKIIIVLNVMKTAYLYARAAEIATTENFVQTVKKNQRELAIYAQLDIIPGVPYVLET